MMKHRLFLFLICIASGTHGMQESFDIKVHKIENNYTAFSVTNNNDNSMDILVHHYYTNPFIGARIIIDNNNNPIFYAHTDQGTIIRCNLNEPNKVTLSTQPLTHNAVWTHQDASFTVTVNNFLKNAVTYENKNWITWKGIDSATSQNESPHITEQEKPKQNTATTQQASTDIKNTPDQNAINNKTTSSQTLTSTQSQSTASTTQPASFVSAITVLGKYSAALLLIAGIAYVAYKKIPEYLQARKNAQEQTHDATIEIGSETNTSTQNNTDEEIIHDETTTTIVASTSSIPDEFLKEPVI